MADKKLFLLTALLITASIVMSYSLTTYVVLFYKTGQFHFLVRQAAYGILSIMIMWSLAQLNPDIWLKRLGFGILIVSMLLMIAMPFLPSSLVFSVGGAKRWIKIDGFSLAPVEFFKVGFVYFLAWSFARKLGHHGGIGIKGEFARFLPYAILFIIIMFIIAFVQNDLGQVVVLGMTLLFMLMFAGSSFKFFGVLFMGTLSFFVFFILTSEHRIMRIRSWWAGAQNYILEFFPEVVAKHLRMPVTNEPYQIGYSLNAIHHGGLFGTGLGDGTFKLGFLSEVHTDFVLAGTAEELGFAGVVIVTLVFAWIIQRIFKIANRSENPVNYLFSLGIGLVLAFAFLINAYGISGITPIKGISVPFFSYGGSAIIASSVGVGMVLMASKRADMKRRRINKESL
jgi:cell division protein FtsW